MKRENVFCYKLLILCSFALVLVLIAGCLPSGGSTTPVLYGSIDVNSTPSGAKIFLDGIDTGKITPATLDNVTEGNHSIKIDLFHYKHWQSTVMVQGNQTTDVDATLIYANAENIVLQPDSIVGKDAVIWDTLPNENFGDAWTLYVGHEPAGNILRAFLQFDLSNLPSTAVVIDADLGLFYFSSLQSISTSIGVYQLTENWLEDFITWNNQPSSSSIAESITYIPADGTFDFIYWNIANLVKGWQDGSIANYGMLLRDIDESTIRTRKYFYSSDYSNTNQRPKLVIDYYIP